MNWLNQTGSANFINSLKINMRAEYLPLPRLVFAHNKRNG